MHMAIVNDVFELPFVADTGADCKIIPRDVVSEMRQLGVVPQYRQLPRAVRVEVAGGQTMRCTHECTVDLKIWTAAGNVNVRGVNSLVMSGSEQSLLLGRPTLESLGIDVNKMLEQLAAQPQDDGDDIPEPVAMGPNDNDELAARLEQLVQEAKANGFPHRLPPRLQALVQEYADCWRIRLGADGPARVEPLRVTLKPDSRPYRCKQRRYSEEQSRFMRDYVKQLEEHGLIRRNNQSKWASPTVLERKQGTTGEYRITNDYRPLNAMTVPMAGTISNLAVAKDRVRGAKAIGKFDLFKGFWQFPLHEYCQELFSFMTDEGIYTPTRVPQGAMDSAVHFQNQMQAALTETLYRAVIMWIDDIVLFARDEDDYLNELHKFFSTLREYNLKLSATKSTLFARSVTWCGRVIDGTVERLNRDILQVIRVLLLETRLDTRNRYYLLTLIQANLNQSPMPSLAGRSPMELFTALQPTTVLDTLLRLGRRAETMVLDTLNEHTVTAAVNQMRASLEGLHQAVVDEKERRRLTQMVSKNGVECNFHVEDYVLWSRVDARMDGNKLMVRWVDPFKVVEARPYTFMIKNLLTKERVEVHASRLKYYADSSFEITEEVKEHIANQGMVLAVERINEHRYNRTSKQWELLISWKGLQRIQDSWEPITRLCKDIPVLLNIYFEDYDVIHLRRALTALDHQ